MMDERETSIPNMARERLLKEFAKQPIFDTTDVFRDFSSQDLVEVWVTSIFKGTVPDVGVRDFKWDTVSTGALKRKFSVRVWPLEVMMKPPDLPPELKVDLRIIDMFATTFVGEVELFTSRLTNIITTFQDDALSIIEVYEFKFTARLLSTSSLSLKMNGPEEIAQKTIYRQYKVCTVPIRLLRCWMRNVLYDDIENIKRPEICSESVIQYGSASYPSWLIRLIRLHGSQAVEEFLQAGFMGIEVYEIINDRLKELAHWRVSTGIPEPEIRNQPLAKGVSVTESGATEPPRSKIADQLEAVKVSERERERLRKVASIHEPLSYSKWKILLHYESKSGPHSFFKKMAKLGIVTVKEGKVGLKADLTSNGQRVIDAFE